MGELMKAMLLPGGKKLDATKVRCGKKPALAIFEVVEPVFVFSRHLRFHLVELLGVTVRDVIVSVRRRRRRAPASQDRREQVTQRH